VWDAVVEELRADDDVAVRRVPTGQRHLGVQPGRALADLLERGLHQPVGQPAAAERPGQKHPSDSHLCGP